MNTDTHTGKPIVRFHRDRVVILCPLGHMLESHALDETWGGSDLEARIAFGLPSVTCSGALPKVDGQ